MRGKLKNFIWFFVTYIMISFPLINAFTEFNSTEVTSCMAIQPKTPNDCFKNNKNYKTLLCCSFIMMKPLEGNICVPMSTSFAGMKKDNINTTLAVDIVVTGNYTCNSRILTIGFGIWSIFFIFLNLI